LVYFVAVISIIAAIHELGHFVLCKIVGVRVDEFSLGCGKLLYARKWGETEYALRAIPFAAFVRPAGMSEDEPPEEGYVDPGERGFNRKSSPAKHSILFGGPVANFVGTVIFLTILYAWIGERQTTIEVAKVGEGSPAQRAGIVPGDVILAIGEMNPIKNDRKAVLYIRKHPGQELKLRLRRGQEEKSLVVVPDGRNGEGQIGIFLKPFKLSEKPTPMSLSDAYGLAMDETAGYVSYAYMQALGMLKGAFTKREIPQEIGGPVSIVSTVGSVVKKGLDMEDLLYLLAMLSMAIGVFNLLPVPGLDGGRIFVLLVRDFLDLGYTLIFWKRPSQTVFSHRLEDLTNLLGVFFLIGLLVIVTFKDIRDLVSPQPLTMPSFGPSASPSPSPRR